MYGQTLMGTIAPLIFSLMLIKDIASQRHYNRNKCQNNKHPFLPKLHGSETIDNSR